MSYRDKLLKQVDILLKARVEALENGQFDTVSVLSRNIYDLLTTIENNT